MKTKKDFSSGGFVWDPTTQQMLMVQVENLQKEVVWTFPKGHPENGETDEQAALREVEEETGWECRILSVLKDVHYTYSRGQVLYQKTVRWFLMAPLQKRGSHMPGEIMNSEWVSWEDAIRRIKYDSDKDLMAEVKSHLPA